MNQPSLFDPTPKADCVACEGRGFWVWYRHGTDPKNYPRITCTCTKKD